MQHPFPLHEDLSLAYRIREPRVQQDSAPLLILLHGVGSNERDLLSLEPGLDARLFVVSARAPLKLEPGRFAWFNVTFTPKGPIHNAEEAEASRRTFTRFIDELTRTYPVDPRRVFLLGFSQGAIMGYSVALTAPEKVSGIAAMSGRILQEVRAAVPPSAAHASLSVLTIHGVHDAKLPVYHARSARDFLGGFPLNLTYGEYDMAHEISQESLADSLLWLARRLEDPFLKRK